MKFYVFLFAVLLIPFKVLGISAASAIAMDLDNGRVLYGYNTNDKMLIASTTKIMTAIVAIENGNLDKQIEITDVIYEAFGSAIYVEVGEKISLRDLLYGLMLRSGNDAALAIAEAVSGSEEAFVYLMNDYAANLNMKNTIFYNPHGLEESNGDGNLSTSYDMAKLTKYAMQNKVFQDIFKTKKYTVKTNYKTYVWHNKNKLLQEKYITGGKTGFTEKARRTLVTTGNKDDINIVVVTLNDPNDWQDHRDIYDNIFNKYDSYELINKNKFKIKDESYYNKDTLYIKHNYNMTLKDSELKKVSLNYNLMKLKEYVDDTIVGYIEVKLDKKTYHKEPIYVKVKKTKKEDISWVKKFRKWLFKW